MSGDALHHVIRWNVGYSSAAGYIPIKKPLADARSLDPEGPAASMRAA